MKSLRIISLLTFVMLAFAISATAQQRFVAVLDQAQEVPPSGSAGTGYGNVTVSPDLTTITVNLGFTGLGTAASAAHIHTAPTGSNGPVTFGLSGVPAATSGVIPQQTFAITLLQLADLAAGNMYFNIHSAGFPGGEIRGQILPASCTSGSNIEVHATAGTLGPTGYTTLAGAFTAINAGTHQGAIDVEVCGNTTETATASLLSGTIAPAAYTSLRVYPVGAARIIEGSIVGAIIRLNGADNVTIDGRLTGIGTSRDLTVRNNSTAATTAAIWLSSVIAGNGASNNTIRNLEIAAGALQNTGTNATFGIIQTGTTISVTATDGNDNDNNSFIANRIIRARTGIASRGVTTNNNINPIITDNIIGPNAFGPDEIGANGIYMQADTGAVISQNTVQFVGGNFANSTTFGDRCGICIGTNAVSPTSTTVITSGDYTVTRNVIHDIVDERTGSAAGIVLGTTRGGGVATNNLIANNFLYNLRANGTTGDWLVGIQINNGHTDRIVHNSISITGDMDPTGTSTTTQYGAGIRINNVNGTNNANFTVANNSFYFDPSSNNATTHYYAMMLPSNAYAFGSGFLNYNNYYRTGANAQVYTGGLATVTGAAATTELVTLANWQAALTAPQDPNSIQMDPLYTSNTADLHIPSGSPNVNTGITIAGVTTDIDNETRDATPDIGADEFIILPGPGEFRFSSATYAGSEGATASITVQRINGGTGSVMVDVTIADGGGSTGGAACTAGVDYINPGTQTLTFPNGVTSQSFIITLCSDVPSPEAGEIVNLGLTNPTGGAIIVSPSAAVLTITDVPPATLAFSVATASVTEGTATVVLTVNRTGTTTSAVTVDYALGGGTAVGGAACDPGVDYITPGVPGSPLTFIAGDVTETITITICNDADLELAETFTATLSNPSANAILGATTVNTVTINDNEPRLTFSAASYTGSENLPATVVFTVTRTGDTAPAVTVDYAITNGTATGGAACGAGVDFITPGVPGSPLSFVALDTSETITVTVCDDADFEPTENFTITLSNPLPGGTAGLGAITVATGNIADNEATFNFSAATYTGTEAAPTTAVLTVNRTGDTVPAVTVDYTLGGGSATGGALCGGPEDYINTGGTLTFISGDTSETITVTLCDDAVFDPNEIFVATLSNPLPSGSTGLGATSSAVVTITDNETPGNDTCASAQALTLGIPQFGSLSGATNNYTLAAPGAPSCFTGLGQTASTFPGRDRVYSFTPTTTGTYNIRAKFANTGGNVGIYVTDSCPLADTMFNCQNTGGVSPVATNATNRNTNTTNAQEDISCMAMTASQTYYVMLDETAIATGTGNYEIEVISCPTSESGSNDTPATANSVPPGNVQGTINPATDVDFFSLGTYPAGSRVFAMTDTAGSNLIDSLLNITTATDTLEHDDDDGGSAWGENNSVITGVPLPNVPVYARVASFNGASIIEPYNFIYRVTAPGSESNESEPNNSIGTADMDSPIGYYAGNLSSASDTDFFMLSGEPGTLLFVAVDANPTRDNTCFTPTLTLFSPEGLPIATSVGGSSAAGAGAPVPGNLAATSTNSCGAALTFRIPATLVPSLVPQNFFVRVAGGGPGDFLIAGGNFAPLAAEGSISGRVTAADGNGIRNAVITVTGGNLTEPRVIRTSAFGYYSIDGLELGNTYVVTIRAKRFVFENPSRIISLQENVGDLDFQAIP